jgi:hypothetical protein
MDDIQAAHADDYPIKHWLEQLPPTERQAREERIRGHQERVAAELRRLDAARFASAGR